MFGRGRPTCVASPDPDVGLVGESFPAPWRGPGRYRYRQTVGPHGVPWPRGIAHRAVLAAVAPAPSAPLAAARRNRPVSARSAPACDGDGPPNIAKRKKKKNDG